MKDFFTYFIKHYKVPFTILIAGILLGLTGLKNLRREARPPVEFARLTITTAHPGSSAQEVEDLITNKLEDRLRNISGIKHSYSVSSPDLSRIELVLDLDNINLTETINEVHRAVQSTTDLPYDLLQRPSVSEHKTAEIPILHIALTGENKKRDRKAHELKLLLQNLPFISEVALTGYTKREYQILLDPEKVKLYSIHLPEVIKAVQTHIKDISAGAILSKTKQEFVQVSGKIKKAAELEDIIVRSNFSGRQISIKDIATVKDSSEDKRSAFYSDSLPATKLLIKKQEKADIIKSVQQIKIFLSKYEKTLDPSLKIKILYDESQEIKKRLNIVTTNTLVGLALVLIMLFFFLPGLLGLAASFSLPFSILTTTAIVASMGVTFNTITMCAFIICIGMLVDNSIVISEHYAKLRLEGLNPIKSSVQSVMTLWKPVLTTTITTILAFLPMLITKGVMGQFIRWIPIVTAIALSVSLIEAFLLLPCRLRFTLSHQNKQIKTSALFLKIKNAFELFLLKALNHKYLSLAIIFGLIIGSIMINKFYNRFILFHREDIQIYESYFTVDNNLSLSEMEKIVLQAEKASKKKLGEENVIQTHIELNSKTGKGLLTIEINESLKRKPVQVILKRLNDIDTSSFKKWRFEAIQRGPPVGRPVQLILFSQNEQELEQASQDVLKELASIEGLINIEDDKEFSGAEYNVYPNEQTLARLKLNPESIGQALRTALQGSIIDETSQEGENFYIRLKYSSKGRSNLDVIKKTPILTPEGYFISLDKVTQWKKSPKGSPMKKHYGFMPAVTLYADVETDKITSIEANSDLQKKLPELLKKYPAVLYKLSGEQESTKESFSSLLQAMLLVVFGIFAVLLIMFNSISISVLILSNIFLGLIGVSWAFLLHSKPLSFFALIGIVGLAGVVINSAIILVSFIENLRVQEKDKPLNEVLAKATSQRLRPIFITTTTTVLGLFPTAYGIGGYDSILIPITLSLTWGLISGTLLTLIWTPCGYAVINDIEKIIKKLFKK